MYGLWSGKLQLCRRCMCVCMYLLLAIVSDVVLSHSSCCSQGDRALVQQQWNAVWRKADSSQFKQGFASSILQSLMNVFPELRFDAFHNVNATYPDSGQFRAHSLRVVNAFDMLVNSLEDEKKLQEELSHLAEQHARRPGVRAEHMQMFGMILNYGLLRILDNYDAMAWKSCWKGILHGISEGLPV